VAKFFRQLVVSGGGLRAQLLRGSLGSIGIKASYVLLQFSVGVLLARMLGPEALGIYAVTMALVQLLVIGAQFGFPAFLVRSVAVSRVHNANAEIKGMISGAGQIVLTVSLTLLVIGFLWLWQAEFALGSISRSTLAMGLILLPLLALTATISGAIRGLGHVIVGQLPDEIFRPVTFLSVLAMLFVSGAVLTPERALFVHGFAALVALTFAAIALVRLLPDQVRRSVAHTQRTRLLRQSLPFFLLAGAQILNGQTDILMLGLLTTQEQVGLYRVALQVSMGIGIVLFALSTIIAPQLARLHAQGDWERIQKILVYSHRGGSLVVLPLALAVALFSGPLLTFVFGQVYHPASGALEILAIGAAAYALVGFSGLALSMLGRPGAATIITLVTVALNVALNLLLIPHYGIEGAALATAASMFVVNAGGVILIWRAFSRNVSAFALIR